MCAFEWQIFLPPVRKSPGRPAAHESKALIGAVWSHLRQEGQGYIVHHVPHFCSQLQLLHGLQTHNLAHRCRGWFCVVCTVELIVG